MHICRRNRSIRRRCHQTDEKISIHCGNLTITIHLFEKATTDISTISVNPKNVCFGWIYLVLISPASNPFWQTSAWIFFKPALLLSNSVSSLMTVTALSISRSSSFNNLTAPLTFSSSQCAFRYSSACLLA